MNEGMVFKEEKIPPLALPLFKDYEPLEIVLKLPGESCNLNCTYCYEKRQPNQSSGMMSKDLIHRLFESIGNRPVSIGLHGGEPLLIGKKSMRDLLSTFCDISQVVDIKLQTNGELLDAEWISIFLESKVPVTIGISHDGPGQLSRYRVSYNGSFTKSSSDAQLRLLTNAGLNFGVLCVISQSNLRHAEELIGFFASFEGLRTINFVPCFDYSVKSREFTGESGLIMLEQNATALGLPAWAIGPLEFLEFLRSAWRHWRSNPVFVIEPFVSVIRAIHGMRPESCDFTTEKCGHILTVYPDGRVTSCDEFESEIASLGHNLWQDPYLSTSVFRTVETTANKLLEDCESCSHKSICRGGCIATRQRYYGSQYFEEYCQYKRALIDFVRNSLE